MKKLSALAAMALACASMQAATIYVENQVGYADTYLYAWGEVNDILGGWPGEASTGSTTVNGASFLKFDVPAEAIGKNLNFIFNNNAGDQVEGFSTVVEDKDYYLTATSQVLKLSGSATPMVKLYVLDESGWPTLDVYAWNGGGAPELFGGWPGSALVETVSLGGQTYKVLDVVKSASEYNLIFNNGTGGESGQFDADQPWTPQDNAAYKVTTASAVAIAVPSDTNTSIGILDAADADAVYYTLQGVKVANPDKGIYIKVCAGKSSKVIL